MHDHSTRESWLAAGMNAMWPLISEHGYRLPSLVRVACAFSISHPAHIGETVDKSLASDGAWSITVCPTLSEPIKVLATLLHEMCHTVVGLDCDHGGAFEILVRQLGFEGNPNETKAEEGSMLYCRLSEIADALGEYPHNPIRRPYFGEELAAAKEPKEGKERKSNLVVLRSAVEAGYTVKISRKTLAEAGAPRCPWEEIMIPVEDDAKEQRQDVVGAPPTSSDDSTEAGAEEAESNSN